jgi:hypothetical protein
MAVEFKDLPPLETPCGACDAMGSVAAGRCVACNGAGAVPTEFGAAVLRLVRHNFPPMVEDFKDHVKRHWEPK